MSTKFLRSPQVEVIAGLSRSTIRRLEKRGLFPARRLIGTRAVGWVEEEVLSWISESNQRVHGKSKGQASSQRVMINSETHEDIGSGR